MKKLLLFTCMSFALSLSTASYANWFLDIINAVNKQGDISSKWLSSINRQQQAIVESQRDINNLMRLVNGDLTGHSGWGTYQFHDYQSYGATAKDWSSVLQMIANGHGEGALANVLGGFSSDFAANKSLFNKGIPDVVNQKYFALKAETLLATRAASQLDYNKIQDQIAYQQLLQQQIEKTNDLKAAIDLSNRIQVEGNLITLEILRQSALTNQQQSISEQASINSALAHAKFLTKE